MRLIQCNLELGKCPKTVPIPADLRHLGDGEWESAPVAGRGCGLLNTICELGGYPGHRNEIVSALFGIDVPTCTDNVEVLEANAAVGKQGVSGRSGERARRAAGPLYACLGLSTTTP